MHNPLKVSLPFTALACLLVFAAPSSSWAEDDLRARYMKVCSDDIAKNDPIRSSGHAREICECRTRFLWAKHSEADIRLIVESVETNQLMRLPDRLLKAGVQYWNICANDSSANP